jgi:hypothetical protein
MYDVGSTCERVGNGVRWLDPNDHGVDRPYCIRYKQHW